MVANITKELEDILNLMMGFHFSARIPGGLLFNEWIINSAGGLVGGIVVVFLLATLYEGLKTFREYLVFRDLKYLQAHTPNGQSGDSGDDDTDNKDKGTLLISEQHQRTRPRGFRFYSISITMHLIQSALHVVQIGLSYILMLVVMTFNGWLFLAVSFGAGVGYLLFAKSRHLMGNFREQNEHRF